MAEGVKAVKFIWQNGQLVPLAKAVVNVLTPAVVFGANVFEGTAAYWNAEREEMYCFRLADHFKRLNDSTKVMRMPFNYSTDDCFEATKAVIRANEYRRDIHILQVVYVDEIGGLFAHKSTGMFLAAQPHIHLFGDTEAIACRTSSWTRISDVSSPPRVKCGPNYQNGRLASLEARADGYHWAVILTNQGKVSEAPGACLFLIRDGVVITPTRTSDILESVTRDTLLKIIPKELGLPVEEREVDRTELYVADEVFLCGSGAEVMPVASLDRIDIGTGKTGPLTKRIRELYFKLVRGQLSGYEDWLTPVYGG